jgi:acyl carrier protein
VTDVDTAAAVDPELRARIVETVCGLLPQVLKREVTDPSESTALLDDLGMSSTTALELVLELEDRLEREISVEDLGRDDFTTVATLADYVSGNLLPEL